MRQVSYTWPFDNKAPGSGEAWPNGPVIISLPNKGVFTNLGEETPPDGHAFALYAVCSKGGRYACIGSKSPDEAFELVNGQWESRGLAYGPHSVWFDEEEIKVNRPPGPPLETKSDAANGIFEWTEWNDLRIGQGDDEKVNGGVVVRFKNESFNRRLAFDQLGLGAIRDLVINRTGDDFAMVSVDYLKHIVAVSWFTLTELRALPKVVDVVIPPKPPVPDPPPVEDPTMVMPDRVKEIVQALYERHVDLSEGTDDQRRQLMLLIAQQVCFERGPGWGTKRAAVGNPPSKDAIAFQAGPTHPLYAADCFNGTTRKPDVPDSLGLIPGQVFIAVSPIDHLGVPPVTPPVDNVDLEPILARLTDLEEVLTKTVEVLVKLRDQQYEIKVDVGRSFAHSHHVTAKLVKVG